MRTVVAGCRLHFGLFAAGATASGRRFGGCGVMIRSPAVTVTAEPSREGWSCSGSLGGRALHYARQVWDARGVRRVGFAVRANGPPEHVGLGIGTALGLAVARAVTMDESLTTAELAELAERVGRGKRSGIGLHGFDRGGLLVDAGKPNPDALPELAGRCDVPPAWRFVVLRPATTDRWAGEREQAAFDQAPPTGHGERLVTLPDKLLLPAARAADFDTFAAALGEYNRLAGEPFARAQGGPYAGARVTKLIDAVQSWGWAGVGQSSWGPTIFAVCPDESSAAELAARCRSEFADLEDVTVTAAKNDPASADHLNQPH